MDTVQIYSKGPLAGSLNAFLRSLEGKKRSELTRKAYHTDLLQFFIWLKENNSYATSPDKITKADVTEFLPACARRGLSGLFHARKLAALREYYRYFVNHELIVKAPTNGIETPKKEHNVRKFLIPHGYNTVLATAAGNSRDYAIFQAFLQTRLRVSELCALRLAWMTLN